MQLRPEDETADGEYQSILRYGGLAPEETQRIRIEREGIPELNLDDYSAIIVGGSPFDITTPAEKKSSAQNRLERDFRRLFDEVVPRDFPFLGACSGNGLLGSYCGAVISRTYSEPVGGADLTFTDAGMADPLLKGFPRHFRALLGHKEACDDTPPGAVLLASSEACPVQMFRLGDNVYATQFHPEGDPEGFIVRVHHYKDFGYFAPETADHLIEDLRKEQAPIPQEFLKRFVNRYRR